MIRHLGNGLKLVCVSILLILLLVVCWQVISRYVLGDPSTVSEELARILLMWLGMMGAAYTYSEGQHIAMETLKDKLTAQQLKYCEAVVYILTAVFACVMLFGGIGLVDNALELSQTTPVLGISMGYVYLAVPIAGFLILLEAFLLFRNMEFRP